MAKKRGPDGLPIDIPSSTPMEQVRHRVKTCFGRKVDKGCPASPGNSNDPPKRQSLFLDSEKPTKLMSRTGHGDSDAGPAPAAEPRTMVAGGGWFEDESDVTGMADPVVGWLAVVAGPGKGASARLGNGQNSIGRGAGSRVRLDFGDRQISRSEHAVLTYDPRSNRFFIQQGNGVNLVYLEDKPVLSPTPLPNGSRIILGKTTLRFVALCDDEFTWLGGAESESCD